MDSRRIDGFRGRHRTVECEGLLVLDVPGIHDGGRGGGALRVLGVLRASHREVWCSGIWLFTLAVLQRNCRLSDWRVYVAA